VVVPAAAASDGSSIHGTLRDATGDRGGWTSTRASFHRGHNRRKHSHQTVTRAEASIRTSEQAQLVAQGKILEEEVSTRG
jgi:hypothetical protein